MVNLSLDSNDYCLKEINELCELNSSSYSKKDNWEFINYLDTKNIIKGEINEIKYLDPEMDKVPSRAKRKVNINDIIISTVRPNQEHYGIIKKEYDNFLVSTGFTTLTVDTSQAVPEFIYYYITQHYITQSLQTIAEQSTTSYPSVKPSDIGNLIVELPSLDIQNKIANILTSIENKINVNKEINKNLFNIIDFIFKDYVGDYEDLEIVSLSENTQEIIRGFNSKYVEKSNIKNFNQKVNKGTFLEKQHFKYLDENIEIPKAKFAKKRDVLVNSLGDGTVGRPHYYNEDTDNVVVDQHITIIRANEDLIPSTYIYEYLKNSTGQYHLDSLISGSTGMLMLNISEIRNLKIPILDKKNLREFDTTVTPLFDKITKNFEEIYCLSKLRDTLLPKLMSGEIDVSKINCDLE